MKQNLKQSRGFIHIILAVIVIVLILTYFKFDLRGVVESDTGQSNFGYLSELAGNMWDWLVDLLKTAWRKFLNLIADLTK